MASDYAATSQWIKFFSNAGLPPNVAANYAIIFADNRIQMDMLMDLSKEYLYDMGIRLMGDVISILRHAKETHNQLTKEKLMADISDASPSLPKRSTPVKRMLGHYTRSSPSSSQGSSPSGFLGTPKKIKTSTAAKDQSVVVSLKRSIPQTGVVMKKMRTALPGDDVTYEVKLPLGSTERSRKLLQLQKQQQGTKKSVFQRLGDSVVSSTTDTASGNKNSPIFCRLGHVESNEVSTSTSAMEADEPPLTYQGVLKGLSGRKTITPNRQLQHSLGTARRLVGSSKSSVLQRLGPKPTSVSAVSSTSIGNRTVVNSLSTPLKRTGSIQQKTDYSQGIFGANRLKTTDVKSRLGFQKTGIQQKSTIIRLSAGKKLQSTNRSVSSVFQRLGALM